MRLGTRRAARRSYRSRPGSRINLLRLHHRCLCPTDPRLARVADGTHGLRAGSAGEGPARTAPTASQRPRASQRQRAATTFPTTTPSAWRRPPSNRPSAASGTTMTTSWPRPLQGRGHSPARPMAVVRDRRVFHPRMKRLVQPSAPDGAHKKHTAPRSRSDLFRDPGQSAAGCVAQTKQPSAPSRLLKFVA